jgi:hypothetical protein
MVDEERQAALFGRDLGMARAEQGAGEDWITVAERAAYAVAAERREFTSEDVRELLRRWEVPEPANMRAMGPVMRRLAAAGAIVPAGFRNYKSRKRHLAPSQVWRSTLG